MSRYIYIYIYIWKKAFDRFFSKTPERWQGLRNFAVKRYVLSAGENISVGRRCKIHKNTRIGNRSGVGFGCEISNGVTIGNDVMMGPNVLMYTQDHCTEDPNRPMREQGMTAVRPIVIEDNVYIGARVIILPGVTVGTGSILGAGAVVAKDIPPYSVAVGNPARIVKTRTSKENEHGKVEG